MHHVRSQPQSRLRQDHRGFRRRRGLPAALLALVLLSGCGRAEQRAEQSSPAPLSLATPDTTTPTPAVRATPVLIRPTPDVTQAAATVTVAFIKTSVAANLQAVDATLTAEAAWAQTPEPTLLPPADGPLLRDLWPAAPQQAAPPSRLYLRSFGDGQFEPDTFWEVRLSDAQTHRLPTVEKPSIDQSAQVSPDGRFLAYLTGNAKSMERTLRLLDLTQNTDQVLVKFVSSGSPRCLQPFAWSPDSRSLAVITLRDSQSGPLSLLQLYDDVAVNQAPQTLVELPSPLRLLGWLDAEHLLLTHWDRKQHPAQLLSVDRQDHTTLVSELPPGNLNCASLSPDRQTLIYNDYNQVKRIRIDTGQQDTLDVTPNEFRTGSRHFFRVSPNEMFWVGDGQTLLISRFGTDRRVWLRALGRSLEQIQDGIFLSPPHQAAYDFGIIGVSPDNHTLVACEQAPSDNPRIRTRESRTWLYSLPDNRWTLVRSNPSGACDLVLGWGSIGDAR